MSNVTTVTQEQEELRAALKQDIVRNFMSIGDCAQELKVTRQWLWLQTKQGRFPHIKYGRRIIIDRREFEKFVAQLPSVSATHALRNFVKKAA